MTTETSPFDPDHHFRTPEAQAELLKDAFGTGDAGYVADALGIVARARGVAQIAESTGLTRAALYKGLTRSGDPKLSTFLGILKAAGFELTIKDAA